MFLPIILRVHAGIDILRTPFHIVYVKMGCGVGKYGFEPYVIGFVLVNIATVENMTQFVERETVVAPAELALP